MAENFGGTKDDYDVVQDLNRQPGQVSAIDGDLEAWDAMMATGANHLDSPTLLEELRAYLDPENFADYMILNFYSGNTDWDNSNWRAGRRRAEGEGYKFFAWDSERTVGDAAQADLTVNTDVTGRNVANRASGFHRLLTASPEYRVFFPIECKNTCVDWGS